MIVSVEEMKKYLRVDFDDDDSLIEELIKATSDIVLDIARVSLEEIKEREVIKIAVMYGVAYMYENKESINYKTLTLSLRSLLGISRRSVF